MHSPTYDPGFQAQAWEHGDSQEVYLALGQNIKLKLQGV